MRLSSTITINHMAERVLICRSNPIAPDPRVEKIANALSGFGYSVSLLGWDRTGELPAHQKIETPTGSIQMDRLPIIAPFGHGLSNLPNLLRWQVGLWRWLVRRRHQYDLIHACDFDTILPALLARKLYGKKVIYDIFDFYADHLRATPAWIKKLIHSIDIWSIGQADALILADDSRWEQINGAHPRHSAIIYNTPAELMTSTTTAAETQPETSTSATPSLRLAYIGLLQRERGLFDVIAVLKKHPLWSLELAGFGGDEDEIQRATGEIPNIHWHGRVPYDLALQLSQAADVLFALYDPTIPNHRYSSPNKVFEAMLLGKPIVVARGTNMDRIIEKANCGLVVEYGDQPGLESTFFKLERDLDLRDQLGRNARQAYQTTYGWSEMQNRLGALYAEV